MSGSQNATPQPQQSSLSFTQGFLLGQLSVVILISAFIKFFIFGEPPSPETTASARALARRQKSSQNTHAISLTSSSSTPHNLNTKRSANHVLRPPPRLTTASILSKTYYNLNSHQPESLDWFNVLIAQTIAQFRNDAHDHDAILTSLTGLLNGPQKPDFISVIKVTELSLGDEFPILSNCKIYPVNGTPVPHPQLKTPPVVVVDDDDDDAPNGSGTGGPRLQAHMDLDLSDLLTLALETKMTLNYPKPHTAVLPIALSVSLLRFSGTLSIAVLPSTPTTLAFSFLPDYRLDLSVRSLLGSRSRLQDLPKIAQMVESRVRAWIDERCVEPRVQRVVLPSLWPRKGNGRGEGEGEDGERGGEAEAEARREVEEEERRRRGGRGDVSGFEEGLRWRNRQYENMPGAMPGVMDG